MSGLTLRPGMWLSDGAAGNGAAACWHHALEVRSMGGGTGEAMVLPEAFRELVAAWVANVQPARVGVCRQRSWGVDRALLIEVVSREGERRAWIDGVFAPLLELGDLWLCTELSDLVAIARDGCVIAVVRGLAPRPEPTSGGVE